MARRQVTSDWGATMAIVVIGLLIFCLLVTGVQAIAKATQWMQQHDEAQEAEAEEQRKAEEAKEAKKAALHDQWSAADKAYWDALHAAIDDDDAGWSRCGIAREDGEWFRFAPEDENACAVIHVRCDDGTVKVRWLYARDIEIYHDVPGEDEAWAEWLKWEGDKCFLRLHIPEGE